MVDIVSIIIAVISITGTLLATALTAWFVYSSDEQKQLRESERLLSKYRDPLLLACQDLQSRLYNITDHGLTYCYWSEERRDNENGNEAEIFGKDKRDNILLYTTFVVGQYFSWTHILRRQAQFLRFSIDETNKKLTEVMAHIRWEFGTDSYTDGASGPFMLWRGEQMALGEMMTAKEDGGNELYCMGYAAFREKWARDQSQNQQHGMEVGTGMCMGTGMGVGLRTVNEDEYWAGDFRPWFRSIVEGVVAIARANARLREWERNVGSMDASENGLSLSPGSIGGSPIVPPHATFVHVPDYRLRRIQHLLLDLIQILDPKGLRSEAKWTRPCQPAPGCGCSISAVCSSKGTGDGGSTA